MHDLTEKAKWLRREIFELVVSKRKGHIPSCFSIVEILVALYYGGIKRPQDKVIISKGHAAMALYPILCDLGLVDKSELAKFTDKDGIFRMYADPSIPGVPAVTGSLGHGIGIAAGYALAAKMDGRDERTYVILGDGECDEGSVYESINFVTRNRLSARVRLIIDKNGLCIWGEANCGFPVNCNGHNFKQIMKHDFVIEGSMVANTVKGKGISFMENKAHWHNRMMNAEEIEQARKELA